MPKRTDHNQPLIVRALRSVGATVQPLHTIGRGCPDLLVGFRGVNFVLEVKNPTQKPSDRRLTPDELAWHEAWGGQKAVVETEAEALKIIGVAHSTMMADESR
jgi:hypothetical protein